ncbi:MAG: protein kinase [Acidobacteria bacterium]|nr:protein kinase [Acidobacteriota bacterium]
MSAQWQKVKEILQSALELSSYEREQFLDKVCGDDESLRREVETLLASSENVGSFMEQPAIGEVAEMFVGTENNLQIGESLNHYRILSHLGAGGMGEVYLAEDTKLNRFVALKLLPQSLSSDQDANRLLLREAQAAATLDHPHICQIHEIAEMDGRSFIVMQFCEGETLAEKLERETFNLRETLDLAIQIADALANAHSNHVIHRDIKPANIIVNKQGQAKILDFGLATIIAEKLNLESGNVESEAETAQLLSAANMIIGTAPYMSPEQVCGKPLDARTDIFSLGVLLYEMLSGKQLFNRESHAETISAVLNYEPPIAKTLADTPTKLQRIVRKSLAKDKEKRYQTAKDLLVDLKDARQEIQNAKAKTQILEANSTAEIKPLEGGTQNLYKRRKFAALAALATFVVALAVVGYFAYFASRPPITSVAVLPFQNASGDASLDYLSDGLSESVIDRLSQLPQLKVIARSSSFKYRGEITDVQDVANKLGVRAIVMGKVDQRGDNLSIRVEMVDASKNKQLWGEQYNRKAADALAVQQEIAQTVSEELRLKLTEAQEQQITKQFTNNPQAYRIYLNGVFLRRKGGTENVKKSLEYQNQALALDPNFALAYTEVARGYNNLVLNGVLDPKEGKPKARAAIEKALELDETLAEVHLALARIKRDELDWMGAERDYKRAIELNLNLADAYQAYSVYLVQVGRTDEALTEIERAQELDPLRIALKTTEGNILYFARRYDEAIQKLQDAVEKEPDNTISHYYLGYAYIAKGQYAEAISSFQLAIKINGETTSTLIYLGQTYAKSGKRDEALVILNKLKTTEKYVSPAELAILYTALGDKEKALELLEQAYAARDLQLQFLKVEPGYDALREDPRFQDLLRHVGLAQ